MGYGDDFNEEPLFRDAQFRKKPKKHNKEWPVVEAPKLGVAIADSHAHLDMLPDAPLALARAAAHGIGFIESMIDPLGESGMSLSRHGEWLEKAARDVLEICGHPAKLPKVRVAIGVHPHCSKDYNNTAEEHFLHALHDPLVSAVGEVGLDYHYDLSPREDQRRVFARQVKIAQEAFLPVLLHVREAHDDAYAIMQEVGWPQAGVLLHCYTSDASEVRRWVDAGCYVAFGGAFTFKKLEEVRAAALLVPRDRLLLETDAPFMAPEPFRGTTCESAHTLFTAERMLEYFRESGSDVEGLLEQTYANAIRLLDRPPTAWQEERE